MIMIFPGLLFALLLNTKVQGVAAAVSPVHPWGCHFPRAPAAPLVGFPKAPPALTAPLQPEPSGVRLALRVWGTAVLQIRPCPGSCCSGAFPALGRVWEAQGAAPPAPCSTWGGDTCAMPVRCPASWHRLGLQGAGAIQEHHSSVAAPSGIASPAHSLQPHLGTWPRSPCPLSPLARPGSVLCARFLWIPGLVAMGQGSTWGWLGLRRVLGWPCQCWCLL